MYTHVENQGTSHIFNLEQLSALVLQCLRIHVQGRTVYLMQRLPNVSMFVLVDVCSNSSLMTQFKFRIESPWD